MQVECENCKNYVAGDVKWHILGTTETRKDVSWFFGQFLTDTVQYCTVRFQICRLIRAKYSCLCTNHIWGNCNCYEYNNNNNNNNNNVITYIALFSIHNEDQ